MQVFGYQVVVNTKDWEGIELGAYVVPDSIVDTKRPEFKWLDSHYRVRVKKLRGIVSQGLLVPAPPGSKVGDDVAEILGVIRYEPPEPMSTCGDNERGPDGWIPTYDVESWHRYKHLLMPGEPVVVTEKIHGASAKYRWFEGRIYCGSRTAWKKEDSKSIWWKALERTPSIIQFCQANPTWTLYGEVYGQVQDLKYGAGTNDIFFAAFDIWDGSRWLGCAEIKKIHANGTFDSIPTWVPVVYEGPYDEQKLRDEADLKSVQARRRGVDQLREGVVVRPQVERTDPEIGRIQLKLVSDKYLERG